MREIKFRGKDVKTREWVYGYLIEVCGEAFIVNTNDDGWVTAIDQYDITYRKVIPDTVGQYTGHKDTNGKEIYEGDIRKGKIRRADKFSSYGDWIYDVYILEKLCSSEYYQKDTKGKLFLKEWDITVDMGIIGNIHDNPELLK